MNEDYSNYEYEGKLYPEVDAYMLWSLSSLDGVMTGIADYNGKVCFAKCHQCFETRAPRYFWLYPLTEKEIEAEWKLHRWFQKYFGFYTDYKPWATRRGRKPENWREKSWEYLRVFWNKNWDDRKKLMKKLEIPYYRTYDQDREAVGFFTFERIMENKMEGKNYMSGIEYVYHSGYWDGPLSGMCRYQGRRYWFSCVHDYHDTTDDGRPLDQRIFGIYELTDSEWKEEEYWHNLFEKYVGTHTRYEDNRRTGQVGPSKLHNKFYDESKAAWKDGRRKKKELTENKLIGYFDTSEMKFRKTKYRDYWIQGESPHSVHNRNPTICPNYELVEWREDAHKWDHFDSDFEGKSKGWAVCISPDGLEATAQWMIVNCCPWCGASLATAKKE